MSIKGAEFFYVGHDIKYRGNAMGPFPKGIDFVVARLESVCGSAAFIKTGGTYDCPKIWGVKVEDCYEHWSDPALPTPVIHNRQEADLTREL
jgi:hypothetical protein